VMWNRCRDVVDGTVLVFARSAWRNHYSLHLHTRSLRCHLYRLLIEYEAGVLTIDVMVDVFAVVPMLQ